MARTHFKNLSSKKDFEILAMWTEAQKMVTESQGPASAFERTAMARRVEMATEIGAEALKRGLVMQMT